jgi:hypothetical protein
MESGRLQEVSKVQMELTELMEEMAMMQKMCRRHPQLLALLVLKVNAAKKVLTVLQDQAVQQVQLELQVQWVQLDQPVQLVPQAVVQLERKVRRVPMEQMAVQAVRV